MKTRGREHTSLTETAKEVVTVLKRLPNIKMIAPGEISMRSSRRSNKKFLTITYTTAGLQLIITGQSSQKVAVHTQAPRPTVAALRAHKRLQNFVIKERERTPSS